MNLKFRTLSRQTLRRCSLAVTWANRKKKLEEETVAARRTDEERLTERSVGGESRGFARTSLFLKSLTDCGTGIMAVRETPSGGEGPFLHKKHKSQRIGARFYFSDDVGSKINRRRRQPTSLF